MSETFITIIAIMSAVVLMFAVPFIATANQNEKITQSAIQTILDNFTNTVAREGKISKSTYNDLIEELHATGNTYDVTLEFKILDENPGKKTSQTVKDKIGENYYTSVFTTQIEEVLKDQTQNNTYKLHEGDIISVTVKNTSVTFAQKMESFLYAIIGKDAYKITTSQSGLVTTTGK